MAETSPVLVGGAWKASTNVTFQTTEPATGRPIGTFPVSEWSEIATALESGLEAYELLRDTEPSRIASFLRRYADRIDERSSEIAHVAHRETALPIAPRLIDVELPRTTGQLRQAAEAAEQRAWTTPVLSPEQSIASMMGPIPGPVCVLGPNNFPLAFNGVSGGDFAAAVATHHPVLAVSNPGHPMTTRLLAEEALAASVEVGLPAATVQLIYAAKREDGFALVADPRLAATAFTGSRSAGLALKSAADNAGKPIYLEMSSVNPVVVLPEAAKERPDELASTLVDSLLLGGGQFCTKPGIVFVVGLEAARHLVDQMRTLFDESQPTTLLGPAVRAGLEESRTAWLAAGAQEITTGEEPNDRCRFPNTLMTVDATTFATNLDELSAEAFGNMGLVVESESTSELVSLIRGLEGSLTGTIFTANDGSDDRDYRAVATILREKVGRLLNNKPPTGVAVVPAMNHGGPFPSTGHPGFTSVGIPASLRRFAMLQSYDNVPDHHLPPALQADNPLDLQRFVYGEWTRRIIEWGAK